MLLFHSMPIQFPRSSRKGPKSSKKTKPPHVSPEEALREVTRRGKLINGFKEELNLAQSQLIIARNSKNKWDILKCRQRELAAKQSILALESSKLGFLELAPLLWKANGFNNKAQIAEKAELLRPEAREIDTSLHKVSMEISAFLRKAKT